MKKLVFLSVAGLLIGGALVFGGAAAGGQLYGAYYNGGLHSFQEMDDDMCRYALSHLSPLARSGWFGFGHRIADRVYDSIDRHFWWNGWLGSSIADRVMDYVDDEINDALDETFDDVLDDIGDALADASDGLSNIDNRAIASNFFAPYGENEIYELDFTLTGSGEVRIIRDNDYGLYGDFSIQSNQTDKSKWSMTLAAGDEGAVIAIPALPGSVVSYGDLKTRCYDKINISVAGGCFVSLDDDLCAQELNLKIKDGVLNAEKIAAVAEMNIEVDNGSFASVTLARGFAYDITAQTKSAGSIMLNGDIIADDSAGKYTHLVNDGGCPLNLKAESAGIIAVFS